jgi:plasmid stabilization system protein ParE
VKIYVTESAYSDLEAIEKYYSDEGVPHVGKQFVANIIEHIQTLAQNPEIGRQVPEFGEKRIRELIHPPFRIVYMKEQSSMHVVRVWRSERLLRLPED